jgi:16S rRNA processing protein RimM
VPDEPAPWRPERARLGVVGKAHGLDGSFRVEGAVDWFAYDRGQRLLVAGQERRIAGRRSELPPVIRLEGLADRDAVEALRGATLELPVERLPQPSEDTFFVFDLVGCAVSCESRPVGVVREVWERPANDVLVLDADGRELLVPFVRDAVPEVDIEGRRLEVAPWVLDEPASTGE